MRANEFIFPGSAYEKCLGTPHRAKNNRYKRYMTPCPSACAVFPATWKSALLPYYLSNISECSNLARPAITSTIPAKLRRDYASSAELVAVKP
jgi:hypothetical protein